METKWKGGREGGSKGAREGDPIELKRHHNTKFVPLRENLRATQSKYPQTYFSALLTF